MEIGYAGAFLGGVLTLLSPCSALLLPAFFAYAFSTKTRLVARTALFYAGLLSTLVPLGVFAGALGSLVTQHRHVLVAVAATLVILLGVAQILGARLPAATGTMRKQALPVCLSLSSGRSMVSPVSAPARSSAPS
jgi:cytochrome c biogenesis protein CcdA